MKKAITQTELFDFDKNDSIDQTPQPWLVKTEPHQSLNIDTRIFVAEQTAVRRGTPPTKQTPPVDKLSKIILSETAKPDIPILVPEENTPKSAMAKLAQIAVIAATGAVGLGCAVMSAYHSNAFLLQSGKPEWIALVTAIVLTTFQAVAFSATVGTNNWLVRSTLYLLSLAMLIFSVFCTISVSFEQLKTRDRAGAEASEFARQTQALIAINQTELDDLNAEISRTEELVDHWRDRSWAKYDAAQETLEKYQIRKIALIEERKRLLSRDTNTAAAQNKSVYSFLSVLFHLPESILRFAAYCIPAVFYDIATPLALGVVLAFLRHPLGSTSHVLEKKRPDLNSFECSKVAWRVSENICAVIDDLIKEWADEKFPKKEEK